MELQNTAPFCSELPKKMNHKQIRLAVDKVLDRMEEGTKFSGNDLPKMCAEIEPLCANTEGETIRRYMRYYRSRGRGGVVCIDRQNGIYMKTSIEENRDELLGELFAGLEKDEKDKTVEMRELKKQVSLITSLLDRNGVIAIDKGRRLSVSERVERLLYKKASA